jgi:hypothetical protein
MVANEAENDMNNANDTNDTSVIAEVMLANLLVRHRQVHILRTYMNTRIGKKPSAARIARNVYICSS